MSARQAYRFGDPFTPRELDVLDLVAHGLTNAGAARRLGISEATVKTHMRNMSIKTGCDQRAGLVGIAYRSRLLEVPASVLEVSGDDAVLLAAARRFVESLDVRS